MPDKVTLIEVGRQGDELSGLMIVEYKTSPKGPSLYTEDYKFEWLKEKYQTGEASP